MKKILSILLCLCLTVCVFAGCSSKKSNSENKETTETTVENPTDDAKIKDSDAIEFIKNAYTKKELGLDKVKEKYSFMISSSGEVIEGKKYIKVAANVMNKNDTTNASGQVTYTMKPVGEYYISYDGKTVLMKDLDSGKYTELENRYQDYSEKGNGTTTTEK